VLVIAERALNAVCDAVATALVTGVAKVPVHVGTLKGTNNKLPCRMHVWKLLAASLTIPDTAVLKSCCIPWIAEFWFAIWPSVKK
jgi:hypothetical protein